MTEEEGLKRLRVIIDRLGWYTSDSCSACNSLVKFSVVDLAATDGAVECPNGHHAVFASWHPSNSTTDHRSLFEDAIEEIAKRLTNRMGRGCGVAAVLAHTSLEVFLSKVIVDQLVEKKVDDTVIQFILDEMRPDIRTYLSLLEKLGIVRLKGDKEKKQKSGAEKKQRSEEEVEEDFWRSLRGVSDQRNGFVHRGREPSDGKAVWACEKIAEVFWKLRDFHRAEEPRKPPEEI